MITLSFMFTQNIEAQNVQIIGKTFAPAAPLSCQDLIYTVNYQTLCSSGTLQFDSVGYTISGTTIALGIY